MKTSLIQKNRKKLAFLGVFALISFFSVILLTEKPQAEEKTGCGSFTNATSDEKGGCILPEVENSSQTIKGEILTTASKLGEPGNYCAKFKLGISGHHDVVILEKNELSAPDEDLSKCKEVSEALEKAYAENKVSVVKPISDVLQPFRESYYYRKNYPEQVLIPGKNFSFFHDLNTDNNWKYDKNYYDYFYNDYPNNTGGVSAIQSFCRVHLEEKTNKLLSYEIRYRPAGGGQNISKCAKVPLTWNCTHKNVYTYGLRYDMAENGKVNPIAATEAHKCQEITLNLTPNSEWFQTLTKSSDNVTAVNNVVPLSHDMFVSPPTDILACSDQTNCLASAIKHNTGEKLSDGQGGVFWGKGAQKISSDFISGAQKSINAGDDTNIKCTDGKCLAYLSGPHTFKSTIPSSSYFGQCGNDLIAVDLPETSIPAISTASVINVFNRPPSVQVSFNKTQIAKNEEIEAVCDVVDPDSCSDKIIKIKWKCFNSSGDATACFFGKNGIWKAGDLLEEIPESSATSSYRATANFKVGVDGNYAVSCEAWDNDKVALNSGGQSGSSSSTGLAGLTVGDVIAAEMNFCAIIPDSEETDKTACGETGKAKFKAYSFGIDSQSYVWQCSKDAKSETSTEDKKECNYSSQGSFLPSLKIVDKNGKEHVCTSTSNIKVTNSSKCKVLSRALGSTDDYSSSLQIQEGNEVESVYRTECFKASETKWNVSGGSTTSSEENKVKTKWNVSGDGSIGATLKNDKDSLNCEASSITVKAKVMQGVQ